MSEASSGLGFRTVCLLRLYWALSSALCRQRVSSHSIDEVTPLMCSASFIVLCVVQCIVLRAYLVQCIVLCADVLLRAVLFV
jgi:hypothetical protein